MHRAAAVFVSAVLLVSPMTHAQPGGMPSDIEWKVAEQGAVRLAHCEPPFLAFGIVRLDE